MHSCTFDWDTQQAQLIQRAHFVSTYRRTTDRQTKRQTEQLLYSLVSKRASLGDSRTYEYQTHRGKKIFSFVERVCLLPRGLNCAKMIIWCWESVICREVSTIGGSTVPHTRSHEPLSS